MSINSLFNAAYYSAVNPDLAAAGLTTEEQLFSHFQNSGLDEGRSFSPSVDLSFYRLKNPDLAAVGLTSNRQLYEHLQNSGVAEGRQFSPLVDLNFYLASNADVNQAYGGNRDRAFEHLQNFGISEYRQFSPLVNLNLYLAVNPDVFQAYGSDGRKVFQHLQTLGIAENRRYSLVFDSDYYRQAYPDLAAANLNNQQLLQHFEIYGLNEGRRSSENFDIGYYLENNPDLKAAGYNYQQALQHALVNGPREARPSSLGHTINEPVLLWKQQRRVTEADSEFSSKVAVDSSGTVRLALGVSFPPQGFIPLPVRAVVVAKYDSQTGTSLGTPTQIPFDYYIGDVAFDSVGNTYLAGRYFDRFSQGSIIFSYPLLAKYDTNGAQLWQKTRGGTGTNFSGVAVDSAGNAYVAGSTIENLQGTNAGSYDAFVAKYDTNGTEQWLRQLGTSNSDTSDNVAVDSVGNVYVVGSTQGDLGGTNAGAYDAFVAKYDSLTGTRLWLQQLGSSQYDFASLIAADNAGNVYVAGYTTGSLAETNGGGDDIWVAKYDSLNGTRLWLRQFGTSDDFSPNDIAVDGAGSVYISGYSRKPGGPSVDFTEKPFVVKYDSGGNQQRLSELGLKPNSSPYSFAYLTADSAGDIYLTGSNNRGTADTFLAKYSPVSTFF